MASWAAKLNFHVLDCVDHDWKTMQQRLPLQRSTVFNQGLTLLSQTQPVLSDTVHKVGVRAVNRRVNVNPVTHYAFRRNGVRRFFPRHSRLTGFTPSHPASL